MRWTLNCILLASIAAISAVEDDDTRIKRDLTFIKNLVTGSLFGFDKELKPEEQKILVRQPENYRLFRVPGFEKILVKAIPKVPGVDTTSNSPNTVVQVSQSDASVELNPNIAIVNSYLGTNELNQTLLALQGVKNLLQSGILDREGGQDLNRYPPRYPTVVVESGDMVVEGGPRPVLVKEPVPIPMGYRPVDVKCLPELPIPTKYSYEQINKGGVTSYTAKDNQKVTVSEINRPVPLPPYVTYRIQEALSMGSTHRGPMSPVVPVVATGVNVHPQPIPIYNVPKVQVISPPVNVMPSYVSSGYSINQVHVPPPPVKVAAVNTPTRYSIDHLLVPPPPAKVATLKTPSDYSYNQVHNDGTVTTYSGSGRVLERKGDRPTVVIAETTRPAPLPVFLTSRIEKAAATAMAARIPNSIPHALYEGPLVYRDPYPVLVEETPTYVYDHVNRMPPKMTHWHREPLYREDVHINFGKHRYQHPDSPSNGPSGYSYKTVHADGSVSTYTDSGVFEDGNNKIEHNGAKVVPNKYQGAYNYQNTHHPLIVEEEIHLEPPFVHNPYIHGHSQFVHSKPVGPGYFYKTVQENGLLTTYSQSGHVEHQKVVNPHTVPLANPHIPVMVPEVVSPAEFFEGDFNGPQKVMFAEPVLSQYMYKQINHNDPNAFTTAEFGPMTPNGQVNVKVGAMPAPSATPYPYVSAPIAPKLPVLPSVTPKGPNEYVFVPPSDINEPLPTRRPVESDNPQSSHIFTHVTNEGVQTNQNGAAAFESTGSVVKVVKTSSSVSTKSGPSSTPKVKTVRVKTKPRVRVSTTVPTTTADSLSLSANPIVVLPEEEQTFSFKQDRADGSSITVVGNNKNVSVIEDNRTEEHNRGDIPDRSF